MFKFTADQKNELKRAKKEKVTNITCYKQIKAEYFRSIGVSHKEIIKLTGFTK
jgi:hypothetical protein